MSLLFCSAKPADFASPNALPPTLFELRATGRATKGCGLLTAGFYNCPRARLLARTWDEAQGCCGLLTAVCVSLWYNFMSV